MKEYYSELNAIRYNLNYDIISKFLLLATPIYFIAGYFNLRLISIELNFPFSLVYSVGDVFSSSLGNFDFAIITILVAAFFVFKSHSDKSRLDYYERNWLKNEENLLFVIMQIFLIGSTIIFYFVNISVFYQLLPIGIMASTVIFIPRFFIKYFKNPFSGMIVSYFLIILFALVFSSTMTMIHDIKNGKNKFSEKFAFKTQNKSIVPDSLFFVSKSSNYYIFWDKTHKKTILYPLDKIDIIELE